MATAGVMLLKGPQARRYTQKAVHTQGGTHKRRSVATAESCYERGHRQGGTHTRRNTQKAVCGHRRSHVIKGATGKAVHTEGGAHTRRNTQKAVCGHCRRLVINIQGGGLLVYGGITTRVDDGLNRTFGRPIRPAEGMAVLSAGRRYGRTFGHFFGQNKGGVTD